MRMEVRVYETVPSTIVVKPFSDALTSNVSTFPYSAKPIARFMKLLEPYRTTQLNHHILCVVARLNSHIGAFAVPPRSGYTWPLTRFAA